MVTLHTGEPTSDAVTALWKDGLLKRLDLRPLSVEQTGALVSVLLGGRLGENSTRRLHHATSGNPLWLRHLVSGELLCPAHTALDLGGRAGVDTPPTVDQEWTRRLHRMQTKLENSAAGRALISSLLIVTLAAILATNLPDSELKVGLYGVARPYLNATGLDQDWGIFSPDPRRRVIYVESRIDYADGTSAVRPLPGGPGLSAYHDYRWRKFGEQLRLDKNKAMWLPFAEYVANRERADGYQPARVTLVRRWYDLLPPGPGPDQGPWHVEEFFILAMGGPA